jgi:hypothetical protein
MTEVLTPDDVFRMLQTTAKKGHYKPVVKDFANSGDLYWNITDKEKFPQFVLSSKGEPMTAQALKSSLQNNIDKLELTSKIKVIVNGDTVLIANQDVLTAQLAESNDDDDSDDSDDEV